MRCLTVFLMLSAATLAPPAIGSITGSIALPAMSCQIVENRAGERTVVYEGGAADPECRAYHPEVWLDFANPYIDDRYYSLDWNPSPDEEGFWSGYAFFNYAWTPGHSVFNVSGDWSVYLEPQLSIPAFSIDVPVTASLGGTGHGMAYISFTEASWYGIEHSPDIQAEYPAFSLDDEAVVLIGNISGGPWTLRPNDPSVPGFGHGAGGELYIQALSAPAPPMIHNPEPSTALLVLAGVLSLAVSRVVRRRRQERYETFRSSAASQFQGL